MYELEHAYYDVGIVNTYIFPCQKTQIFSGVRQLK